MAIHYDFFETEDTDSIKGKLRAKEITSGTISTAKLIRLMEQNHGLNEADTKKFIATFTDNIIDLLLDGYEVQVGELGYISASVTSKLMNKPKGANTDSVRFGKINFRSTRRIQKILKRAKLELISPVKRKKKEIYGSARERALELKNYLKDHNSISRAEYMRITGLSKNTAVNDLNIFIKEGWLCREGSNREVLYYPCSI